MIDGRMTLILKQGEILTSPTDVIVCSTDSSLQNSFGLARALINKAGPTIQQECKKWIENFGEPPICGCVITGPGDI